MKKMFSEYDQLSDKDFKNLWNNCIFVFDTNILFNFYRYSEEMRNKLFEIFEKNNERIWLPYQVGYEYNKNRLNKIKEAEEVFDKAKDGIQKSINQIKENLEKIKYPSSEKKKNSEIIKKIELLHDEISKVIDTDKEKAPNLNENDFIRDKLFMFFNEKVGMPYNKDELKDIYDDGKKRYDLKIPPGYEDRGKNGNEQYGDLVIWKQIIDKAKEMKKPIIFITDDNKEDWWWIINGKKNNLRPELIKEFKDKTGQIIWGYTAERFMEYIKLNNLGIEITNENIKEAKESRRNKYELTKRELEVLDYIVVGKSNTEIAKELSISVITAKAHVCSILQKMFVGDRVQAAVKAIREGVIPDCEGYYDL